jgi:hypothetical protein
MLWRGRVRLRFGFGLGLKSLSKYLQQNISLDEGHFATCYHHTGRAQNG